MMMYDLKQREVFPGVRHITDNMGVCMTLLTGENRALLVDTGYGMQDVSGYIRTLTDLPLTVLLTHGHHDHVLGSMHFTGSIMFPEDQAVFLRLTGTAQRKKVIGQAEAKNVSVPGDYPERNIPTPCALSGVRDRDTGFDKAVMELGHREIDIYRVPGHTAGSAVIYIPEYRLLLSGDNWNPCTWVWFPEAMDVRILRDNMLHLSQYVPYEHVLCSHREQLFDRQALVSFYQALTDEKIQHAEKADMGSPIDTRRARPTPDTEIVFDYGKASLA